LLSKRSESSKQQYIVNDHCLNREVRWDFRFGLIPGNSPQQRFRFGGPLRTAWHDRTQFSLARVRSHAMSVPDLFYCAHWIIKAQLNTSAGPQTQGQPNAPKQNATKIEVFL